MRLTPTIATVFGGDLAIVRHRDCQEVAEARHGRQPECHSRTDDEGGSADDEREREEERTLVTAGQQHQEGRAGDRHAALDDELGSPESFRRKQVVDDEDEDASEGEEDEDPRLRLGPQAGDRHDRRGGEDEDPADDPDDAVVGARGHAIGFNGQRCFAGDDRQAGGHLLAVVDSATERQRPPPSEQRGQDDRAHHHEIGNDGEQDERQDRFNRHG